MAPLVLTDTQLWFDGYELTGFTNQVEFGVTSEEKDATTFGSNGWRERKGGLKDVELSAQGLLSVGTNDVDDVLLRTVAASGTVITAASGAADGDIAYFLQALQSRYNPVAQNGELVTWELAAASRGQYGAVRGMVLHPDAIARTGSGNGVARQLGDVATGERLYAALHVLSVAGTTPSLTVKVQSDDTSGFVSPTDRITFTAATAVGAQWATPVSPTITDTWWRINWTITGTNPSFLFAAVVGIQ